MIKKRFHFFVAVHAFFIKSGKVLLLKRANTGYMDGFYSVPAGHVDGGESISTAMNREIDEEVGITLGKPLEPYLAMHRLISANEERIDYFFKIRKWIGNPQNLESNKSSSLEWHDCNNLPKNTIPYVEFALNAVLEKRHFVEFSEV